jgi:hypothetical protein
VGGAEHLDIKSCKRTSVLLHIHNVICTNTQKYAMCTCAANAHRQTHTHTHTHTRALHLQHTTHVIYAGMSDNCKRVGMRILTYAAGPQRSTNQDMCDLRIRQIASHTIFLIVTRIGMHNFEATQSNITTLLHTLHASVRFQTRHAIPTKCRIQKSGPGPGHLRFNASPS